MLPRLVGASRARELSFFPGKFGADEAFRPGLVNAVFDDDRFRDEEAARVQPLLTAPPVALRAIEAHFVAAERMGRGDFVDLEAARNRTSRSPTADASLAFVEPPRPAPAAKLR